MILEAHEISLRTLLAESKKGFSIPEFQRNYNWTESQVVQFWQDLISSSNNIENHFFGPIVALKSNERIPIIDGQQRLTTLMIVASVIRDYLHIELENPKIMREGDEIIISHEMKNILFLSDGRDSRLESNYQIKNIFDSYIVRNPKTSDRKFVEKDQKRLLKSEKKFSKALFAAQKTLKKSFLEWLEEMKKENKLLDSAIEQLSVNILDNSSFLFIKVENETDAYVIFETLNDRGLRLSPADLIKSYLLRKIMEENPKTDRASIIEKWEKIPSYLDDYDPTDFMRHHYLSRFDLDIRKNHVFKFLKNEVEPEGKKSQTSAVQILDNLIDSSFDYGRLLLNPNFQEDSSVIQLRFKMIKMFTDSYRIFLLKVLQLKFEDKEVLLALKAAEILAFRWIIAGQKNAQSLENTFRGAANKLTSKRSELLKDICQELLQFAPDDDIFEATLRNRNSADSRMQAYVMRSLNYGLTGVEITIDRKEVSVEHIAPQNPDGNYWYDQVATKESDNDDKDYSDFLDTWGNITILERPLNSKVVNDVWDVKKNGRSEKLTGYNGSSIQLTKNLMDVKQWNREMIEKRTNWVVEQALIYWARDLDAASPNSLKIFVP